MAPAQCCVVLAACSSDWMHCPDTSAQASLDISQGCRCRALWVLLHTHCCQVVLWTVNSLGLGDLAQHLCHQAHAASSRDMHSCTQVNVLGMQQGWPLLLGLRMLAIYQLLVMSPPVLCMPVNTCLQFRLCTASGRLQRADLFVLAHSLVVTHTC
jgi:hypothetical protein